MVIIVNFALQILSKKASFKDKNTLYKYTGEYYGDNFMTPITVLRQIIKNGWTIANRRNIISQIGEK